MPHTSPIGAVTTLLFSLGMGIPTIIGAIFMARILPTLSRMQRAAPIMAYTSATVMVAIAVLLLMDNSICLRNAVAGGDAAAGTVGGSTGFRVQMGSALRSPHTVAGHRRASAGSSVRALR